VDAREEKDEKAGREKQKRRREGRGVEGKVE